MWPQMLLLRIRHQVGANSRWIGATEGTATVETVISIGISAGAAPCCPTNRAGNMWKNAMQCARHAIRNADKRGGCYYVKPLRCYSVKINVRVGVTNLAISIWITQVLMIKDERTIIRDSAKSHPTNLSALSMSPFSIVNVPFLSICSKFSFQCRPNAPLHFWGPCSYCRYDGYFSYCRSSRWLLPFIIYHAYSTKKSNTTTLAWE